MTRDDLASLRAKYEEMLRLRQDASGADPRRAMAALASRYPGALREIDELPLTTLKSRVEELAAAEAGGAVARWMEAIHWFHLLTRGALCAKRWLGGRKAVDDDLTREFDRASATLCWGEDARAWRDKLGRVANPPRGRVTDLVFEEIGARLSVSSEDARLLVFGIPRARPGEPAH